MAVRFSHSRRSRSLVAARVVDWSYLPAGGNTANKALVESTPLGWLDLLRQRTVWGLVLPRLFSDPVWYFYLFWLPDYLQRERHLSLAQIGLYGWIPFLFADLGNVGGGMLSDVLVRRGTDPANAPV